MREPHLNSAKHAGIEDVHAGVDLIGHEDLRLLHEAMYSARFGLEHHHAVLGRLLHSRHLQAQSDFRKLRIIANHSSNLPSTQAVWNSDKPAAMHRCDHTFITDKY